MCTVDAVRRLVFTVLEGVKCFFEEPTSTGVQLTGMIVTRWTKAVRFLHLYYRTTNILRGVSPILEDHGKVRSRSEVQLCGCHCFTVIYNTFYFHNNITIHT